MAEVQLSMRFPAELLEEAGRLAEVLSQNPDLRLLGVTRASVLRLALVRGLATLAEEYEGKKAAPIMVTSVVRRPGRPAGTKNPHGGRKPSSSTSKAKKGRA